MKLINGQKRADFLKVENSKTSQVTSDEIKEFPQSYMIAAFSDGVMKGIDFAEKELQNLAIEFAKWINDNYDMTENRYVWTNWQENHSTEKCFELFLEWRKKQY